MNPFFLLLIEPFTIFRSIVSAKEHCLEAHLVEKPSIGVGVTEWIDLPAYTGLLAKLIENPLLTIHHVLNHVLIDRGGFIVHGPSSIDDLELTTLDKTLDLVFQLISLQVIPLLEESHLNL